ncbi:MAG: hypothetical protein IPM24_14950 [Bryobacterales bacterium]|nr:hypothetical protein [Bryobacterales bacterium]
MPDHLTLGLATVLAAGFFQGAFMAPSKWIRGWVWENYWLIFAATAYLLCPWILAALTIPGLFAIYARTSAEVLGTSFLFGTLWGLGAVTFGLGVDALGMALGFAVILGVATTAGTVVPLLVAPPPGWTTGDTVVTAAALALLLAGVATCSLAGRWKEQTGSLSYGRGVLICIVSGALSACGNLGFAFGGEVTRHAQEAGIAAHVAPNALWTLLTLPLFFWNAGFAGWRLRRNGTARHYREPGAGRSALLAMLMGAMWMAGIGLYGSGARRLGDLGPSLGWAILMSSMIVVANFLGLATGEWKGAPRKNLLQLCVGAALLTVAIGLLGAVNARRG